MSYKFLSLEGRGKVRVKFLSNSLLLEEGEGQEFCDQL